MSISRNRFWVLFIPSLLFGGDISPKKIVQNVEKRLASAKTLKVLFQETYIWTLTGEEQSIRGEMILKNDDKFRVTTDDQIIVSDGKTLWTFSKPSQRVLIDVSEDSEEALYPSKILFHFTKDYDVRLKGEETIFDKSCYVLEFQSSSGEDYYTWVVVWVDKKEWVPVKVEQADLNDNRTIYLLEEVLFDLDVPSATFQFDIPEGIEVIDMR